MIQARRASEGIPQPITCSSSASSSSDDKHGECWFGVTDARKRKQIQDRLAQRARRKRLSESSRNTSSKTVSSTRGRHLVRKASTAQDKEYRIQELGRAMGEDAGAHLDIFTLEASAAGPPASASTSIPPTASLSSYSSHYPYPNISTINSPLTDPHHLPRRHLTAFAALYNNGRILGLRCSLTAIAVSAVPDPAVVPGSLRATPLQLSLPHSTWIDRFPTATFRDNFISMAGVFDEEDFIADFFEMDSLHIAPGAVSWDPDAWTMGLEFGAKWGHLFH